MSSETSPALLKPTPPATPLPGDCCGTGCIPCVMDIYEEEMDDYRKALAKWEELTGVTGEQE
jgi:hypothetical protein